MYELLGKLHQSVDILGCNGIRFWLLKLRLARNKSRWAGAEHRFWCGALHQEHCECNPGRSFVHEEDCNFSLLENIWRA